MHAALCVILLCATLSLSATEDEENQDPETNWSTLSFLQPSAQDSEEPEDLMGAASQQVSREILPDYQYLDRLDRPRLRRRKNRYRMKKRPAYIDYEQQIDEERYYDRDGPAAVDEYDSSYSASSYEAPLDSNNYAAPSYEGPSYAAPSYSAPSYTAYDGGAKDTFNDFLNALAAFLPIGLFLAAIPPNLIVINSARKKRESEMENENSLLSSYSYPFMNKIGSLGFSGLQDPACQQRMLCEMGLLGATDTANSVQKMVAYAAALTPDSLSQVFRAKDVFQAVRTQSCEKFKCFAF